MKKTITLLGLLLLAGSLSSLQAQASQKQVTLTITKEANGITQVTDTSFTVNDPDEIEGILERMGIEEPGVNQTLEKRIVIRDIEEDGATHSFERPAPRAMLGVYLKEMDELSRDRRDELGVSEGLYVTDLTSNSGAKAAGIQPGDVITKIANHDVDDMDDMRDAKQGYRPGQSVTVTFVRNGEEMTREVELKGAVENNRYAQHERMEKIPITTEKTFFGVVPRSVTESLIIREELVLPNVQGIYLSEVVAGYSAQAAGLQVGDVVVEMGGQPIGSANELTRFLKEQEPGSLVSIVYYRDGRRMQSATNLTSKTYTHYKKVPASQVQKTKVTENRAFLGVYLATENDDEGVRITGVSNNSAAAAAGMQQEDVITKIGMYDTPNYDALSKALDKYKGGEAVRIQFVRNGNRKSQMVTLGEKLIEKWVYKEKIKNQAIDIDVIIREFPNQEEAEVLASYIANPSLYMPNFELYPNPSEGRVNLNFTPDEAGTVQIKVFDSKGTTIYREQLTDFEGRYEKEIDLTENPQGIYFLQVTQNGEGMARKIVIQ